MERTPATTRLIALVRRRRGVQPRLHPITGTPREVHRALLLPAVEIGEDAFVAADSIVTGDVPAHKLAMGSRGA